MATHRLSIPLGEDDVRSLRIGDMVYLDGKVHTGRAPVYQHVLEGGREPPLDLARESNVQTHGASTAVEDAPGEYRLSSIQATASFRCWKCVRDYIERFGIRVIIGKGGRDKWVYEDVFARTGTVFLTTVGHGIAALYGRAVKCVIDVHWKEELGLPEAMWVLEVENFGPFIVDGDCTGASLAALAIDKINPNFAREYAKLPDYVLKRIGEIDHSLENEVIVGEPERK